MNVAVAEVKYVPKQAPVKPPYNSRKDAYRHLVGVDGYQPFEYRPKGRWIVVFFKETMTARIFPTLENVADLYSWCIYMHDVYISPEHMAAKIPTPVIKRAIEHYNGTFNEPDTPIELARKLWALLQEHADPVVEKLKKSKSNAMEDDKYHVRVDLLLDPNYKEQIDGLVKQARMIAQELGKAQKTTYTVPEMTTFMRDMHAKKILKTKQDPFRIFRYYAPIFSDMGLVTYRGRKNSDSAE